MTNKANTKADKAPDRGAGRGATNEKERQARQARSLRDNLKKRKQQVRSRDAETKSGR